MWVNDKVVLELMRRGSLYLVTTVKEIENFFTKR